MCRPVLGEVEQDIVGEARLIEITGVVPVHGQKHDVVVGLFGDIARVGDAACQGLPLEVTAGLRLARRYIVCYFLVFIVGDAHDVGYPVLVTTDGEERPAELVGQQFIGNAANGEGGFLVPINLLTEEIGLGWDGVVCQRVWLVHFGYDIIVREKTFDYVLAHHIALWHDLKRVVAETTVLHDPEDFCPAGIIHQDVLYPCGQRLAGGHVVVIDNVIAIAFPVARAGGVGFLIVECDEAGSTVQVVFGGADVVTILIAHDVAAVVVSRLVDARSEHARLDVLQVVHVEVVHVFVIDKHVLAVGEALVLVERGGLLAALAERGTSGVAHQPCFLLLASSVVVGDVAWVHERLYVESGGPLAVGLRQRLGLQVSAVVRGNGQQNLVATHGGTAIDQVQTVGYQFSFEFIAGQPEYLLVEIVLNPSSIYSIEEHVVVVLEELHVVEVSEVLQRLVAVPITEVGTPLRSVGHGVEHLGQILHVLAVGGEALGQRVGDLLLVDDLGHLLGVGRGNLADGYPVAVALLGRSEGGAHADPVVVLSVAVQLLHHVAEAVVGRAVEIAVVALGRLIDNLREAGHLLDVHIDHGQRLPACAVIAQRAHVLVLIGVVRGALVDVGTCQLGKAGGGGLSVVGGNDAHSGVSAVGLADAGGVGGRLPALVGHGVVGQLAHDAPELGGVIQALLGLLLRLLLLLLLGEFVVAARDGSKAETAHQGGCQHEVENLFHCVIHYLYNIFIL